MAKASSKDENKKPKPAKKKSQTVRERTQTSESGRRRRLRSTAGKIKTPLSSASRVGAKEFHLPLPDNKFGRFLKRRIRFTPKFIREAWQEIRMVTWPNARETLRLTMAVFIFAVIFAAIVGALDFGLDKLFREVILK